MRLKRIKNKVLKINHGCEQSSVKTPLRDFGWIKVTLVPAEPGLIFPKN